MPDTELKQYFAIKTDLAAAVKRASADDIDFHINELVAMQMHTSSDRLRRACASTIASFGNRANAANA